MNNNNRYIITIGIIAVLWCSSCNSPNKSAPQKPISIDYSIGLDTLPEFESRVFDPTNSTDPFGLLEIRENDSLFWQSHITGGKRIAVRDLQKLIGDFASQFDSAPFYFEISSTNHEVINSTIKTVQDMGINKFKLKPNL